jgi:SPP1 gp7 family putative phage head morphogenesis protein
MILLSAPLPRSDSPILDAILQQSLPAGIAVSREVIRRVRELARKQPTPMAFLAKVRAILAEYEPMLAATISDSLLAAWLYAGKQVSEQALPAFEDFPPPDEPPPTLYRAEEPDDEEPLIRFPIIEEAATDLITRRVLTQEQFYEADQSFREQAFTISGVASLDALEKIQEALAEDLQEGGGFPAFVDKVEAVVGKSALAGHHLENVYRTNLGQAVGKGQQAVLDNEYVSSAFPYVMVRVTHDKRTRKSHKYWETHGIEGTAIYRSDDPVIRKFWPGVWDFACRCGAINLTREDAAEWGLREAQEWVRTGTPPPLVYVQHPPFEPFQPPPPEWR